MKIDLTNKVAVITGANGGIGREILETFARQGANIIAITRTIDDNFKMDCDRLIQEYGITIKNIELNFLDEPNIHKIGKDILANEKKVDILINNAGFADGGLFTQTRIQTLREVFDVNFFAPVILTQYIVKNMIRNKFGVIINIGSTAGVKPRVGMTAYGASKSALTFWSGVAAKELGIFGIRVNTIAPGITHTKMIDRMHSTFIEKVLKETALGTFAAPKDVANLALFLCTEYASHITGATLTCDGGEF